MYYVLATLSWYLLFIVSYLKTAEWIEGISASKWGLGERGIIFMLGLFLTMGFALVCETSPSAGEQSYRDSVFDMIGIEKPTKKAC